MEKKDEQSLAGPMINIDIERKGRLHSTESMGTLDGPGIRYLVFMQGCQMRCYYCHNRDSWDRDGGYQVSVRQLMRKVHNYRPFMESSNGGITVSGGEPLLQAGFVNELFKCCKTFGIHTCLDTNGFANIDDKQVKELLQNTDLVLLDLKQMEPQAHIDMTQVSNRRPLAFARYLAEINKPTWIRHVVVGEHNDDENSMRKLGSFIQDMKNVEKVELLPYHELGKHKWEEMQQEYRFKEEHAPSSKTMHYLKSVLQSYHNNVCCGED